MHSYPYCKLPGPDGPVCTSGLRVDQGKACRTLLRIPSQRTERTCSALKESGPCESLIDLGNRKPGYVFNGAFATTLSRFPQVQCACSRDVHNSFSLEGLLMNRTLFRIVLVVADADCLKVNGQKTLQSFIEFPENEKTPP